MVNTNISKDMLSELAFTEKELEELRKARSMPVVFDEDCPETTPEKALIFIVNDVSRFTLRQTRGCMSSHSMRVCVHH